MSTRGGRLAAGSEPRRGRRWTADGGVPGAGGQVEISAEDLALEAGYQSRILRALVMIGAPFTVLYGVVLMLLSSPIYVMGPYLANLAVLTGGYVILLRPMPPERFLRVHRVVAAGYVATLLAVQILSIVVFDRFEFSSWILIYPSLVLLIMPRRAGLVTTATCAASFFIPLFLSRPVPLGPAEILLGKANLVLIYAVVAAAVLYIDRTRRRIQSDLARRTREAERLRELAEQASHAKTRFLANMSHELRTPLNHIIGFNELLREMALERGDATSAEYLTDVLESGRHLLSLVNDLLDLARVESGRLALSLEPVSARDLLRKAARLVSDRGAAKGVAVSVPGDEADIFFLADAVRLTQVLLNLLVNGVKFTPRGGRVTAAFRVVDEQDPGARSVEFSVTDTGAGIPEGSTSSLFERFSRLERGALRAEEGTGLGLALSKGIVESHGGRIWARSEGEGKGSTFSFRIPALPVTEIPASATGPRSGAG